MSELGLNEGASVQFSATVAQVSGTEWTAPVTAAVRGAPHRAEAFRRRHARGAFFGNFLIRRQPKARARHRFALRDLKMSSQGEAPQNETVGDSVACAECLTCNPSSSFL